MRLWNVSATSLTRPGVTLVAATVDGGCHGGGSRVVAAARGVLQLHLGVFFWFQYEGDLNDAWECGEEGLGGAEVDH